MTYQEVAQVILAVIPDSQAQAFRDWGTGPGKEDYAAAAVPLLDMFDAWSAYSERQDAYELDKGL